MHIIDVMENGSKLTECVLDGDAAQVVAVLSDGDVNVNERDANGRTLLHVAVSTSRGETDVLRLLLEAGADATVADNRGNTPLHWCCSVESVHLLVEHGADVHVRNMGGLTPRMMARRRGVDKEVLSYLEHLETQTQESGSSSVLSWQPHSSRSSHMDVPHRQLQTSNKMTMSVLMDFYHDIGPRNMALLMLGLLFMSLYVAYTFIGLPTFDDSRMDIDGYSYKIKI